MDPEDRARFDTDSAAVTVKRRCGGRAGWADIGARTGRMLASPAVAVPPNATFNLPGDAAVPLFPDADLQWFGPRMIELRDTAGCRVELSFRETAFASTDNSLLATTEDEAAGIKLVTEFKAVDGGALRIETSIENRGIHAVAVAHLASASFPVPGNCAAAACMSHFWIELDPASLADGEREELAERLTFYKRWCPVLHGGTVRLGESPDGMRWQAHGDGKQWLLFAIRTNPLHDRRPMALCLSFAGEDNWSVRLLCLAGVNRWLGTEPWQAGDLATAQSFDGAWLSSAGLPMPPTAGEAVAILHLERA